MNAHDPLTRLRIENATLRERVRQLEALNKERVTFPPEWKLSPQEADFLRMLLTRKLVTHAAVETVLGADRDHMKTLACRIRQKLKPFRFKFFTHPEGGYYMEDDMKERVRAACR